MVKINDYYKKKQLMDQLAQEIQEMEQNNDLKKEFEFKDNLSKLMDQYGKSAKDVLEVLGNIDPSVRGKGDTSSGVGETRRKRPLKVYKNPHTGEVVKTRGGNQKDLNAWRQQYGREAVDSWVQS
ncbi:histone-like nucleoid-structuring protein, MvaT/MvaU family [Hydrocarboniclastica marina]|uniref:H-NS histone n=1 Tax=Hydrocarboniclastica marina TaxID=2259620 RepID=A0A4V1D8V0_9ALTE|nr:histone-like nucleoid-structuring protein, MvaT/MvaU family [Hydrocarboniclastica marina]MAM00597.1 H-NS histone [Alteromonadaceae bacterium]QCF26460.1 H-NS histone [Hydrocarboniclastica marina]|tara:strand:- start:5288 stop:5662 length:375 start_codon:yes stop_codon:yes gene_type:complete